MCIHEYIPLDEESSGAVRPAARLEAALMPLELSPRAECSAPALAMALLMPPPMLAMLARWLMLLLLLLMLMLLWWWWTEWSDGPGICVDV